MYTYFHLIEFLKVYLFAVICVAFVCWSNRLALEKKKTAPGTEKSYEN